MREGVTTLVYSCSPRSIRIQYPQIASDEVATAFFSGEAVFNSLKGDARESLG